MKAHSRSRSRAAGLLCIVAAAASVGAAPQPAPASSASPAASSSASPDPAASPVVHLATVTCGTARFYSWPGREGVPFVSAYAPARQGDAIGVVGRSILTLTGQDVYETTIDVVEPFGTGRHYYIDARCVLASP